MRPHFGRSNATPLSTVFPINLRHLTVDTGRVRVQAPCADFASQPTIMPPSQTRTVPVVNDAASDSK